MATLTVPRGTYQIYDERTNRVKTNPLPRQTNTHATGDATKVPIFHNATGKRLQDPGTSRPHCGPFDHAPDLRIYLVRAGVSTYSSWFASAGASALAHPQTVGAPADFEAMLAAAREISALLVDGTVNASPVNLHGALLELLIRFAA
jgi:hypothetical protein